jgi:glycosidase
MLSLVRALVRLRAAEPAIRTGDYTRLDVADDRLLAFARSANGHSVTVLANFGDDPVPARPDSHRGRAVLVSSTGSHDPRTLQPCEARVLG